jgi:uncharacterized protein (TIGR02145 family)
MNRKYRIEEKSMKTAFKVFVLLMIAGGPLLTENVSKDGPSATVTDVEGNVYQTVKIGTQIWMAKNLKVTKYRDGSPSPKVMDQAAWSTLTAGAYSDYNNDADTGAAYGRIYNYFAVADARKLCPEGWHIPTKEEWETLINYLGGSRPANQKLREAGHAHWVQKARTVGNNESGFTLLPGGERWVQASRGFEQIGGQSTLWTASAKIDESARAWAVHINDVEAMALPWPKGCGGYIRCIKD